MKTVVVTGSTRGIGKGLVRSFLDLGCAVVVSGRSAETTKAEADKLAEEFGAEKVLACACDVNQIEQVENLWRAAKEKFGKVDIWINNAGMAHSVQDLWDLPDERIKTLLNTNLVGAVYGAQVAVRGMLEQGFGAVYGMEGLGSDGRKQKGMAVYGASKYALRYLNESLAAELKGTPVISGGIAPGMVVTDLLVEDRDRDPEEWEHTKKIFNILADKVETVTPWIAQKVLANQKNGALINWLTGGKIFWRFLSAPFIKRSIVD